MTHAVVVFLNLVSIDSTKNKNLYPCACLKMKIKQKQSKPANKQTKQKPKGEEKLIKFLPFNKEITLQDIIIILINISH